jgi:hypothetical protein
MYKNSSNCWKHLRALDTLPLSNEVATCENSKDWSISSQASKLEEGSTTMAKASRVQENSKRGNTCMAKQVYDIVWSCRRLQENYRNRVIRNINGNGENVLW